MSRHRGIRNRAYSYDDEDYDLDEYDDEQQPFSPSSSQFVYRRDSPSHHRNVFTFVDQNASGSQASLQHPSDSHADQHQEHHDDQADDAELLDGLVSQVKATVGASRFTEEEMVQELRKSNYDLDKSVISLLEKGRNRTMPSLPMQIPIPKLEAVALAIGKEQQQQQQQQKQKQKEKQQPPRQTRVVAALGGSGESPSPSCKLVEAKSEPPGHDNDSKLVSPTVTLQQQQSQPAQAPAPPPPQQQQQTQTQTQQAPPPPILVADRKNYAKAEQKTQEMCLKLYEEEMQNTATSKQKLSMVVIGHVDAGKSTITGHLLYKMGYVNQRTMHKYEKESAHVGKSSFAYAWVMDADEEERSRGVTMDIGTVFFETKTKHVTLLDAPGHRDFIPKMIAGAAQADVAVLVVPAGTGEFEAAFENSGQTKEHTLLVRSLGVTQLVVAINKMDAVDWSKQRFDQIVDSLNAFLQHIGFRAKNIRFIPVSGMTGANLQSKLDPKVCSWYNNMTLVDAIDQFAPPQRQIMKPFRMCVSDVSKTMSLGNTISGRIYAGAVAAGDSYMLMPVGLPLTVKAIEQNSKPTPHARAGETVDLGVTGIDPSALSIGSMLCSIASPVRLACRFEAKIMTMPSVEVPLVKGTCVTIHLHNVDEPANITRLVSILSKSGDVEKKKPRCITREKSAVVQITCQRPICLETFASYRQLGRFTLRDRGATLAAGIITEILD